MKQLIIIPALLLTACDDYFIAHKNDTVCIAYDKADTVWNTKLLKCESYSEEVVEDFLEEVKRLNKMTE